MMMLYVEKYKIYPMYTLHRDDLKSNKGHRDILQYCVFFMVFAMLCSAEMTEIVEMYNEF